MIIDTDHNWVAPNGTAWWLEREKDVRHGPVAMRSFRGGPIIATIIWADGTPATRDRIQDLSFLELDALADLMLQLRLNAIS